MNLIKKFLNKLANRNSKNSQDWILEAEKYLDKGNYKNAVDCYIKALNLNNNFRVIDWFNLSYAYYQLKDYEKALEAINKALLLTNENPEFMCLKGFIHYKLENFDDAYSCLIKASKKIKKSEIYRILGDISLKFQKYEEALHHYLKAHRFSKNNIDALFMAGKVYLRFGDIYNAYESFKKVLEKNPNHQCKNIVNNIDYVYKIINKNVYDDLHMGVRLLERKDYINALKFFNKIITIDEYNDFSYYYKSIIAEVFEEYQKALEYIDKAIEIIDREIYYAKKGDILCKMGNAKAIDYYRKSIEICPNIYAYFGLAMYYYKKEDFEKSSNFFDKVLDSYVDNIPKDVLDKFILYSLIGKAETSGILKYYEGALSYIDNLLDKDSKNIDWWEIKGYLAYKTKKYKEALEWYINALRLDSNNIDIIKSLIVIYEKLGRYDEALSMVMKLKKLHNSREVDNILKKLTNREPTNINIPSPLLNFPIVFYVPNNIQYHLATLCRYIYKNPIGAFIYLCYLENSDIIKDIEDEEKLKAIINIINELKKKLPIEMYNYCESQTNYSPNKEIIDMCKRVFRKINLV